MSGPTHILILPSWYLPDGGNFFRDQALALARSGYKVDILVNRITGISRLGKKDLPYLRKYSESWDEDIREIRSYYLKIPKSEHLNIKRWSASTMRLFRKYVKKNGHPDIILAQSAIWAGYAASLIQKDFSVPYIILEHRGRFTGKSQGKDLLPPFFTPYLEQAFAGAKKILPVSDALSDKILEFVPGSDSKIVPVPNMVDTEFFNLPDCERDSPPFVFFSAGMLEEVKGMDVLLDAFSILCESDGQVFLRIAGKGKLKKEMIRQARELGIARYVTFLGYLDTGQIRDEMKMANAFVLAGRFEAFGVVFIEAMACGLPIIATRSGGPERIIPDFAGKLVDVDDASGLAEAMDKMVEDCSGYNSKKIRDYAITTFGEKVVVERIRKIIAEVPGKDAGE